MVTANESGIESEELVDSVGLDAALKEAWSLSREIHGASVSVHFPGMFVVNGRRGRFGAVSITGNNCDLQCEHCKGRLLKPMSHAVTASALLELGLRADRRGDRGLLITGGCDKNGRLPWRDFLPAIESLKSQTNLKIIVHAGQLNLEHARALVESGVDQALVDLLGDDRTARDIYHLPDGLASVRQTLEALSSVGLYTVPHIIFGVFHGEKRGEKEALQLLAHYPFEKYVVVVLTPARGTPMENVAPPSPELAALFIAEARISFPKMKASLGCARPRGKYGRKLAALAVKAGVNALALPTDEIVAEMIKKGLDVIFCDTCCSMDV
jgi:lipoyl synthase